MHTHDAPAPEPQAQPWPMPPAVEPRALSIDGAVVRYRVWGPDAGDTRPGLLLLHGYRAHSHWWDPIAPLFAEAWRVAVMDMSGLGDSDHRPAYGVAGWAREILAVARAAALTPVTIVAHSYSGHPTVFAARTSPAAIRRAVILDTEFWTPSRPMPDEAALALYKPAGARTYPTRQAAIDRFRLIPATNRVAPHILAHVAEHSVRPVEGGWSWKFDQSLSPLNLGDPDRLAAADIAVPLDYLYGAESGVVSPAQARHYADHFATCPGAIELPGVGHHMVLENPDLVVAALRALLANPRG